MRNHTPTFRSVVPAVAALAAAVAFFGAERDASAQSSPRLGEQGQFAITAENIFGYRSNTVTLHNPNGNMHDTTTSFGLGFNTQGAQAGFHYFLIPGLSLGGSIGYESRGGEEPCGAGNYCDKLSGSTFMFMPRVGYALMLSDMLGFWFRGGPGYVHNSQRTDRDHSDAKLSTSFWTLGVDAFFVVTPVDHVGFYVGPSYDFSFSGTAESTNWQGGPGGTGQYVTTSVDADWHRLDIGLGVIAFF